jgi:hypothetical protein
MTEMKEWLYSMMPKRFSEKTGTITSVNGCKFAFKHKENRNGFQNTAKRQPAGDGQTNSLAAPYLNKLITKPKLNLTFGTIVERR